MKNLRLTLDFFSNAGLAKSLGVLYCAFCEGSDGGSNPQWTTVANGYTYTFSDDGTFSSTRFTECTTGTYEVSSNSITLDYGCAGFGTGIENPAGTFVENYSFESENIILTPSYMNCIEGCGYRFEKIE